jgi:hypothetical protein
MLLLTDDELTVLVSWAEVASSVSALRAIPDEIVAHDFNEEDEGVLEKIEAVRLR